MKVTKFILLASLACLANLPILAASDSEESASRVIYVDSSVSSNGDGKTWSTAFPKLSTALDESRRGDVIKVAKGLYTHREEKVSTFEARGGVRVIGGYEPKIANGSKATILDAEHISGRHIITAQDGAVLEKLTIRNSRCRGNDFSYPADRGGGVYVPNDGTVRLVDCRLKGNYANYGGGVYGNVIAVNTLFEQNEARYDGAAIQGEAKLYNCVFSGNHYDQPKASVVSSATPQYPNPAWGGPSLDWRDKRLDIVNCVFKNANAFSSVRGYGMRIFGSVFADNRGSAVFVDEDGYCKIINSTFSATSGASGSFTLNLMQLAYAEVVNCIIDHSLSGGGFEPNTYGSRSVLNSINNRVFENNSPSDLVDRELSFGFDGKVGGGDDGVRIKASSDSVDAGTPVELPKDTFDYDEDGNTTEVISWDIWGNERIQGSAIDIGAHESGTESANILRVSLEAERGGKVFGGGETPIGGRISIYAIPDPGFDFKGWRGDVDSSSNPLSMETFSDLNLTAHFIKSPWGQNASPIISNGNSKSDFNSTLADEKKKALRQGITKGIEQVLSAPSQYDLTPKKELDALLSESLDRGRKEGVQIVLAEPESYSLSPVEKSAPPLALDGDSEAEPDYPHTFGWYYQPSQGWLFTNNSTFPFVYHASTNDWMYFKKGGRKPVFFHYGRMEWMTLE